MTRPTACLLLCALLGGCASGSLHEPHAATRAADAAAAQALAGTAPPDGEVLAPWLDVQRSRIQTERAEALRRFDEAEKACWQRFAVNDCLRDARASRRSALERLRQQELAVNEVERQRRTAARRRAAPDAPQGDAKP